MELIYRLEQFWQLVRASPLAPSAWEEIEAILMPAEVDLFRNYAIADRRHAYRVLRTLRAAGDEHPDLLAAALLHDVGKVRCALPLWARVAGALADICCPGRVKKWGHAGPESRTGLRTWRRPFVIREQHPAWGAEMAAAAGSRPQVVSLIRHHQDKQRRSVSGETAALLQRLQWADDQN